MSLNLVVSLILVSMSKENDNFVQNYNMQGMGKTLNELPAMLKLHEQTLPKKMLHLRFMQSEQPKIPPPPKKDNPAKDAIYHQCGDVGHWRRNCPQYLAELMKNNKLSHGATSGSVEDLEIIQDEDTHPSKNTSLHHDEDDQEINEPQSDIIPVRRSIRTRHAPDRMCLYINAEEHELGDLNEPVSLQKEYWHGWQCNTYKARLVAKGITQTYEVDYEETFSSVADIRAIRILIAISAYYDYEIWKINVKTAFLNGHLSEEVYVVQPKGEAAYVLGIKIYRDKSRRLIGLCQSAYIEKILKRFNMENFKRKRSIVYVVRCTRADVAFAQNITSRFQQNPGELHWTAVKNILKYLWNTKDMFLVYGDVDDCKSQTGYVFILNGGVVDWKNTKQSIFATSSAKTEYIVASDASKEAV
ncbi:retrotransposon protein, putative, ty1-copia subclass [Tanacetum coccineum]